MANGDASVKMKKAVRKLFVRPWGSLCRRDQQNIVVDRSAPVSPMFRDSGDYSSGKENQERNVSSEISTEIAANGISESSSPSSDKNLCAICLDPLGINAGQPVFTAQCSHAFHFSCISSNVHHGSVTCPICRAHWTQLPRNPSPVCPLHDKTDRSISHHRQVHRNAILRPGYNDNNDPILLDYSTNEPRLHFSLRGELLPVLSTGPSSMEQSSRASYLCVKLLNPPAIDLVLVASPSGPHLRLMKQAMALTVFSLRPVDRLAIVTYSSGAARAFPLRRMTSYGKRTALQIIDHLFYMGHHVDPSDGLTKGAKILENRLHKNPESSILHLTDAQSPSPVLVPVLVHTFHVTYLVHEFEEFLARVLGGRVEDVELRIGGGGMVVSIGEMRGGEERNIPVRVGESGWLRVGYGYREGGCCRRGEMVVGEGGGERGVGVGWGRMTSVDNWGCFNDPCMGRRWANKHLQYGFN